MLYCSFSYTQLNLQAFYVFHPCYPYEFLFCIVLYDLYGFEKCQIFKNGMMVKIGNQKTTRFVPGQNISGLKIKSWNKHVQMNHNFGHISITWPLEMLNAISDVFKRDGLESKKFEKVLKRWIMRPFDICDNYMF